MNLVELWRLKSKITNTCQPFDAKVDIGRAAFDIIMAVSFGLRDEESSVRKQIECTRKELTSATERLETEWEPYPFEVAAIDSEGQAIFDLTDSIQIGIRSSFPTIKSWLALRLPPLRKAVNTKENMMRRHIDVAVAKMSPSDEEAQRKAQTALEYLMFRERSMARKAGRKPNFHGRYVYDEVRSVFHARILQC
jgi:hypothetical protein